METPVVDYVRNYQQRNPLRLHMPGHKGQGEIESLDITEVRGADVLYHERGILRKSEQNASLLFGSGKTLYSTEGSSLCIRAMVYLAKLRAEARKIRPVILAGRNAHSSFVSACALMGVRIKWLRGSSLMDCQPAWEDLEDALYSASDKPAAVYITSPDYLGNLADIEAMADICNQIGLPLMVDNAHGAYLRFLPEDQHPLTLNADLVCDSAHKTLPVLTGGAYLHIHREADPLFYQNAERAMALFASTSPSWLILQSLDRCNADLAGSYRTRLADFVKKVKLLKNELQKTGYTLVGDEPLKVTLAAKEYGYSGDELLDLLRAENLECEFSDPDYLVMMVAPETGEEGLNRLKAALQKIPKRDPIRTGPPKLPKPRTAISPSKAMLALTEKVPISQSLGRILADPCVSCPPAIPILVSGERITEEAIRCFAYYGIDTVSCVRESL